MANKTLAVMQPYFFPYIGYFQLIAAVDQFIVYDNIQYTKKGWINRNRLLQNGKDAVFSLPLKKASDYLNVCERELAADFNRDKLLRQFQGAYRDAPYFARTFPLVERVVRYDETNLFQFLYHSILTLCGHLGITTQIRVASSIDIDHGLKSQDKVLALCLATGADTYINAIGGTTLYRVADFSRLGINLKFIRSKPYEYRQFGDNFVPWLSIIDVLMFNPPAAVTACISNHYELI